jgi:hypothetical protein
MSVAAEVPLDHVADERLVLDDEDVGPAGHRLTAATADAG